MLSFYVMYMIPYLFYLYFIFCFLFIIICSIFQLPSSEEQWKAIADDFDRSWNFPHCIGAPDGKHVVIQRPENTVGEFYNYKGTESIVMMATVDANYCFIYVKAGCQGRISDGGVFRNTEFYRKLENDDLYLLASVFRIFRKTIEIKVESIVVDIVLTCV